MGSSASKDFATKLEARWQHSNSLLCVGLDPDPSRIPRNFGGTAEERIVSFCTTVVDVTQSYVCAFKPQFAHFAALGFEDQLAQVCEYIRAKHPQIPLILDAKRGDIGSTAEYYAVEVFERYGVDAVTVNPFLGWDTLAAFRAYPTKGVIILCRTSNPGSDWLQTKPPNDPIYLQIARQVIAERDPNLLLVVGGTTPDALARIRQLDTQVTCLVPGVGTQGGSIEAVVRNGRRKYGGGLIVNVARAILYTEKSNNLSAADIAQRAREFASNLVAYP